MNPWVVAWLAGVLVAGVLVLVVLSIRAIAAEGRP